MGGMILWPAKQKQLSIYHGVKVIPILSITEKYNSPFWHEVRWSPYLLEMVKFCSFRTSSRCCRAMMWLERSSGLLSKLEQKIQVKEAQVRLKKIRLQKETMKTKKLSQLIRKWTSCVLQNASASICKGKNPHPPWTHQDVAHWRWDGSTLPQRRYCLPFLYLRNSWWIILCYFQSLCSLRCHSRYALTESRLLCYQTHCCAQEGDWGWSPHGLLRGGVDQRVIPSSAPFAFWNKQTKPALSRRNTGGLFASCQTKTAAAPPWG